MARAKIFDQYEVLTKAMETFWLHGYEKSSMSLLVQNMGINRASLYGTFGDKKSLFLAAIAHYNETIVVRAIATLEQPQVSKQTIIDFFEQRINLAIADRQRRGCFLINSALEVAKTDSEIATCINDNLERIQQAFRYAIENAQNRQEISDRLDPDRLAHYLTCSLQGLCVTFRLNPDPELLRNTVRVILSVLEANPPQ
ncbi:MAG: TetR/AcrR family transcriptional regulator [Spirulinaceae cyanobacterium]